MGNALACSVALASLDLLADGSWRPEVARIERGLTDGLAPARELGGVSDVRVLGAIGVIQLAGPVDVAAATRAAVDCGVWVRPFRDLVYTMPPYVTDDADIARISQAAIAGARAGASGR
jgi:adenosylmethionine-8-amino-7-oxononanoate aminotransferase